MHRLLAEALDAAAADPDCRAVLLTGAGRGFCAGQDLSDRVAADEPVDLGATLEACRDLEQQASRLKQLVDSFRIE